MSRQPGMRPAPTFTDAELDAQRLRAIDIFIEERKREGDAPYKTTYAELLPAVERLFRETGNLTRLEGRVLAADPALLECMRFLSAPPISEDDLDTLVGRSVAKRKTLTEDLAQEAVDVMSAMIDTIRCPWVGERRPPTPNEVEKAVQWTTGILAIESLRTERRTESAKRQQEAVMGLLRANGWVEAPRKDINLLDDLPRGHFCGESIVAGNKCDIPVRLHDGRLLALECKVSNSALNSVKRLIRETCGKASHWRTTFGTQLITGAVLAGVYKLTNLTDAQNNRGVAIFWEHDMQPLMDFITP